VKNRFRLPHIHVSLYCLHIHSPKGKKQQKAIKYVFVQPRRATILRPTSGTKNLNNSSSWSSSHKIDIGFKVNIDEVKQAI
jgi:hypothetical protein